MTVAADRRLVTFNSEAWFLPCSVEQLNRVSLSFSSRISIGTFKLRINGVATADITYTDTLTTLTTNVRTAINATFPGLFTVSSDTNYVNIASTSNEFYRIEMLPNVGQATVATLNITGTPAGTVKLTVDGFESADITLSATTMASALQTALNAITGVPSSEFTVAGTLSAGFTITGASPIRWTIGFVLGTSTNTIAIDYTTRGIGTEQLEVTDAQIIIRQQGSRFLRLTADIMSMKFGTKVKTTETAGLAQIEDYPEVVGSSGTFSLSMYGTVAGEWLIPMSTEGLSGTIYWYPTGRVIGETYAAMRVVLDGFDEDLPFHEKVEVDISGVRQGAMIAPKGTIITAADI